MLTHPALTTAPALCPLTAVVGGSIGSDPYGSRTWSGITWHLFREMEKQDLLQHRIGGDIPKHVRYMLLAKLFTRTRDTWRLRYYMDRSYRDTLTRVLVRQIRARDLHSDCLQIGAMFNLSGGLGGRTRCFSYHDGNLSEWLRNNRVPEGLSQRTIEQARDYETNVYRSMDVVFTMSEYLRQSFVTDFGVTAHKVVNIGGGINMTSLPETVTGKDYATKELLFVGIQFARKGGLHLLKAFAAVVARHRHAKLHIVGPAHIDIPQPLRRNVVLHGYLNKRNPDESAQLTALYRRCSLFVMPSEYEPFGIAPLEAMVHQLPAIVTNAWALKEMVRPGEHGDLVARADVQDLTDKLLYYIDEPDLLRSMGSRARTRVMEHYTWPRVVERMKAAIKTGSAGSSP